VSDSNLINLASERLGARALAANDEFFAEKENLVRDTDPVANEDYTERGKWMDGWETRRRREPGHDWCILRLGARGIVRELVVDTTHFKGNHPPECSIEALDLPGVELPPEDGPWASMLPNSGLSADSVNAFTIRDDRPVTHLRLCIYPDGGVARVRALGEVVVDLEALRAKEEVNVAAIEHGAVVVRASDMFFGHRQNLIMPGRAASMRDGWETRRRRGPGHDWAIVQLAAPAIVRRVEVDTTHFKGNAPGSCSVDAARATGTDVSLNVEELEWHTLVSEASLSPHSLRVFQKEVEPLGAVSHIRLNIFPDGGVSRLLVWGKLV
jgi:allantoicase